MAALRALRAVDYHDANQARIFSAEVTRGEERERRTRTSFVGVGADGVKADTKSEREAALMALESAVRGNTDGQILLVSTLAPTGLGGFDDGQNENENDGGDDDFAGETSLGGLFARHVEGGVDILLFFFFCGEVYLEDEKKQQFMKATRVRLR